MNEISRDQATALAHFLLTLRPDWSMVYLLPAIENMRLIDSDVERITRAAVRGALAKRQGRYVMSKPDPLAMHGEHWKARLDEVFDTEPAKSAQCPRCRDFYPPHETHRCTKPATKHEEHAEAMRAALVEARETCCSHGIPPNVCRQHEAEGAET
jgi:hypothetical protein